MRFLFIGDPHFKINNITETDELHLQIEKYLTKSSIDVTIVLGDILDTFERIHLDAFNRAIKFLEMIHQFTHLVLIIGNHDRVNNTEYLTDRHAFQPLTKWDRTDIIWTSKLLTFNSITIGCVPYVPPGRFLEAIELIPNWKRCDLIIAHQEFMGANLGSIVSECPEAYPEDAPLCISGHIHDYQQIGDNLIYPGVPYQQSFTDQSNKYLLLIEIDQEIKITRQRLKLTKKVILTLTLDEAKDFKPEDGKIYHLTIQANSNDVKKLLKANPKLQCSQVKLKIKPIDENVQIIEEDQHLSFLDQLLDLVKDRSDLKNKLVSILN